MDAVLWILQWALGSLQVINFVVGLYHLSRGIQVNSRAGAVAMATVGLLLGVALVLPWLVGEYRLLTPVAAGLIALGCLLDMGKNRMPGSHTLYLCAVMTTAGVIAVARFTELRTGELPL
ncbi:hypothetical protein AB0K48_33975 [Nonomuraea sp. NPDC055795]